MRGCGRTANGIDTPWSLGDGRNRREACRRAEVQPAVEYKEFETEAALRAYILDLNAHRRHLSAGQRAMATATACIYPEPQQGKAGASSVSKEVATADTLLGPVREPAG
jgi:hypothetical protein